MYADGQGGLPRDPAQAVAWYRKAADQKLPLAQLMLALSYATGRGVTRDDLQALQWFQQTADSGLALAQYGLGMMHGTGRGVAPDLIQAHQWLSLAVTDGYVGAAQPLDAIASQMSEADLARARQLAREWQAASGSRLSKPN